MKQHFGHLAVLYMMIILRHSSRIVSAHFLICLFSLLLAVAPVRMTGQLNYFEATFNGGVTVGGWSPDIGGFASSPGSFSIYIEPGSTVLAAYLVGARLGPAADYPVTFNGTDYIFGTANEVVGGLATLYGTPSGVHVYDMTSVIDPTVLNYTMNCSAASSGGYFQDFELVVFYANPNLPPINAALFLNTFNLDVNANTWDLQFAAPIDNTADVMLSFFNSYQCFAGGDSELIDVNGTNIGSTYNNDLNNPVCTGTLGNAYYQSATLTALGDDNANQAVDGYDALSNVSGLVAANSTSITIDFTHGGGNFDNHQWTIVAAYGNSCAAPVADFTANSPCDGDAVVFTNLSSADATSWNWNFGDGQVSDVASPQHTYSGPGTYSVSLSTTNDEGCTDTFNADVVVHAFPVVSILSQFDCVAETFTLSASGATGYLWSPGSESTASVVVPAVDGDVYSVDGTQNGCTTQSSITLSVPLDLVVVLDATVASCGLSDAVITASVVGGTQPYSYDWTGSGSTSATANTIAAGDYTIEVTDADDCVVDAAIQVLETLPPVVEITASPPACPGYEITLTASGADFFVWNTNESGAVLLAYPESSTTYSVEGTTGGCSDIATWTQDVLPAPVIDLPAFVNVYLGESVDVSATWATDSGSEPAIGWYPDLFLDCLVCVNQQITPEYDMIYTVTAIDPVNGCLAYDSIYVFVDVHQYVFAPNTITVNGDDINEVFTIVGIETGTMTIWNRWGEPVFETDNPARGWNGSSTSGYYCPDGVYVWQVEYDTPSGREKRMGHVVLIR